jgi:hypothetical protein
MRPGKPQDGRNGPGGAGQGNGIGLMRGKPLVAGVLGERVGGQDNFARQVFFELLELLEFCRSHLNFFDKENLKPPDQASELTFKWVSCLAIGCQMRGDINFALFITDALIELLK